MEVRSYKKEDEQQILELFYQSFGKKMSLEYWEWRFNNNPFYTEPLIELMWDGNQLVGHYAISPMSLLINGQPQLSALSMTTMTHPEYGGKGIFTTLALSLYDRLSALNFECVWGFPNQNSHYGFIKNLQWQNIAVQGVMTLDLGSFNRFVQQDVQVNSHKNFNQELFNQFVFPNKTIQLNKTLDYFQWRYDHNPSADYKIISTESNQEIAIYKVFRKDEHTSEIDILELSFHDIDGLIRIISAIFKQEPNNQKINLWDSIFSDNQLHLEKVGFKLGGPLTYFGYRNLQEGLNKKFGDYSQWDIDFGYSDIY